MRHLVKVYGFSSCFYVRCVQAKNAKGIVVKYIDPSWKKNLSTPEQALAKIEPGMRVFIGTGLAEPRTMVRTIMHSQLTNLQDLELVQLVSLGDAISLKQLHFQKFRLRTFFSGWIAADAIADGRVDLTPCRFSRVPKLFDSGSVPLDVAIVQITPPDEAGFSSLGIALDVAHQAMAQASIVIGEVCEDIPRTQGDTFVHVSKFDHLVESTEKPIYFQRWKTDEVFDRVAANVASVIEDRSCLSYSLGPLFEALTPHLARKRGLGVHSPFFTDALMDLVKSGAVTNRHKDSYRGKCVTSYAMGTKELMDWLHRNPLLEFQTLDVVANPMNVAHNDRFMAVTQVRKVDLSGRFAFHFGKSSLLTGLGLGETHELFTAADLSKGGRTILALPSRNLEGKPNILPSVDHLPNLFHNSEVVDMVATEYGVAYLTGRTYRERAQALIDIAHPDDRENLVDQAKEMKVLYADQIYLQSSGKTYPHEISVRRTFKDGMEVSFRPLKPSDEEAMRRLFYRFSDQSVYYRYFSPIKTMPHRKMQEYVNVDYTRIMPIVGLVGELGKEKLVAEGRYARKKDDPTKADIAFIVDELCQGRGVATFLLKLLAQLAKDRGIKIFTADVLASNKAMMKVLERCCRDMKAKVSSGVYELEMPISSILGDKKA